MQQRLFKTRMDIHTKQTIGVALTWIILLEAIGYTYFTTFPFALFPSESSAAQGYVLCGAGFVMLIVGILGITREYPYIIYKDGIKFSIYWGLKNGAMFVPKNTIIAIQHRIGRWEGTRGIEIETENRKKYLIVKFYEDQVFPYLQEMMGDRWQEVYKG